METTYSSRIFDVQTMDQAKRIILTKEGDRSTEDRWRTETPYLMSLIEKNFELDNKSVILDYGCGIGRMAKALIDKYGCSVVGVDISASMRALAASYVSYSSFFSCSPDMLDRIGIKFDAAISIWVLQHCHIVEDDINRIYKALNPGAGLFVVNDHRRIVPTNEVGWFDDKKDVKEILSKSFEKEIVSDLDVEKIGKLIAPSSYWSIWYRGR